MTRHGDGMDAEPDTLFPREQAAAARPEPRRRARAERPQREDAASPAVVIASVVVDSPLPHLDRAFDYAVPPKLQDAVAVGSRVRAVFAGRLVGAVVVALGSGSDFEGAVSELRSSSAIPSYTPSAIELARAVARRYGGSLWDVLRLMAPPRVAAIEKRDWGRAVEPDGTAQADPYRRALGAVEGEALIATRERAVWEAVPETEPRGSVPVATLVATAVARVADGGSAILVVPDARAASAVLRECERVGLRRWTTRSGGEVAVLDHDDGPTVRFGSYLAAMHGRARIVIGTRPTALQPVPDLRLIAVWDEANGALEDPHAPYPHARTVAAMRAEDGTALLIGGYALSSDAVALAEHGWARLIASSRDHVRESVPAVDVVTSERRDAEGGSGWHWMPGSVWRQLRSAVDRGPVGIVVPRTGYVRAAACARCDAWAVCRECDSLLAVAGSGDDPACIDEGHAQPDWHCRECQGSRLKHVRQGAERIGEQLQRMLGEVRLTVSTAQAGVVPDGQVTDGAVLATPAALPAVAGGYSHLVILDAGVPAGMGLGGELRAIRWWLCAAALVRSRRDGGAVSVVGELPPAVARALSTWTPAQAALDEYRERATLGLPPHRRHLLVSGDPETVAAALQSAGVPQGGDDSISVVPGPRGSGVLVPRSRAQGIVDGIRAAQRAASRDGRELRLRVDGPLELPR
ncbi:hypothetical protein [Demequina activiva]|uniref:Primosomal protein N n=1 Tax=Demequina activiva TaxID=1582364 RepID=A0A919Q2V7_9MICO|nr:hypothetical protein [Demequina activiva]GIG54599.1 putative primosomal protein N' [Demequina activiva]